MRDSPRVRKPRRILLVLGAAAAVASGPAGWLVTDALERDNDFCNACHLEPGLPLHRQIRDDFDVRPVVNLVGVHASAETPRFTDGFRCIDCHGGVGALGKARVKVLAAKDAFWWVVGHFDEPTEMVWPLRDEDCAQCHATFKDPDPRAPSPAFHELVVHNAALGVACVECHLSHTTGGSEDLYYLQPTHVRAQCAECHSDFAQAQN